MKLILIRHGKTYGNTLKRYIGTTDEPLLEDIAIDKKYPNADMIVSSPLKRCIMTAELIYPGEKISICSDLRETDFGDFENRSYEELKSDHHYRRWIASGGEAAPPNGEGRPEFAARCINAYERIIENSKAECIAFVIHGGTIMTIMQHIFGGDFYDYMVPNLGGYIVDTDTNKYMEIV